MREVQWICPACLKRHKTFSDAEACYNHHTREQRDNPKLVRCPLLRDVPRVGNKEK